MDIILMYIEADKNEIVEELLIESLDSQKNPKVVQALIETLRRALHEFGSKVIPIKPMIKHVPKLLEDRDKNVRDETKLLAIEMYHWAGQAIMPQFNNVKPVLMQELEEEFKKLASSGEKARQTRFMRSQQDLKAKAEAQAMKGDSSGGGSTNGVGGGSGGNAVEEEQEAVDPYDLMEPIDLNAKLGKDFDFDKAMESKKWAERKEPCELIFQIVTQNPRLLPVDYSDIIRNLVKCINDANVNVMVSAAKCVTLMAKGLRKDFNKYTGQFLEPIINRLKEKKPNLVDPLREALDAIYPSTNLEAIFEAINAGLGHKTPCVRQLIALFLAKCFAMSTQTSLPKKVLKLYMPPLVKNLGDADGSVREATAEAIGAACKALGDKAVVPLLGELEQLKMDKIKDFSDKCVLLNLKGEPRAGQSAPSSASQAPVASGPSKATVIKEEPKEEKKEDKAKPPTIKGGAKPGSAKPGDTKKAPTKAGAKASEPKKPDETDLSQEVVEDRSIELFGNEIVTSLGNSNWKDRLSSVESIMNNIKTKPSDELPTQIIVRLLAKKPGLKDSHFQVLKQKFDVIMFLATEAKFTQVSANYCLGDVADKIGDVKNSSQAKETLSKIAECIGLQDVIKQTLPAIFEAKNPKNQEHILLWVSQSVKEFGFTGIDLKSLVNQTKTALQNTNANVRQAAIQLIGTLYLYVGPQLRVLFETEKPALLEQIDSEIEKNKGEKAPAPIRRKKGTNDGKSGGDDDNSGGGDGKGDEDANKIDEDLLPRTDISSLITEELINQLNDKNWKERQAALEKLENILKENKFIYANLGDLPTHLCKRLTDSNKNLSTTSLKLCEKLAEAMGINGKKYCSALMPGMIQALSDAKEQLRKQAVATLNSWFTNCGGLQPFLEGETLVESFSTTNPNLKAELCGWLASVLQKSKKFPQELKPVIQCVFNCVEDRSPDVRNQAQALIQPLMYHVGVNEMLRVLQKSKPTSVTVIQPLIEKAKAELAAKQPAPAPSSAPPQSSTATLPVSKSANKLGASKQVSKQQQEDEDEPKKEEAPPAQQKADAKKTSAKPAATTSKNKKGEEEDLSPPLSVSNKNKRMDDEKALKVLKWNFDVPRKEFVEQLKIQFEPCVNRTLLGQLFHDDFKHQITALTTLIKACDELSDATVSNLDLILKWLTLRFFETNPTVILKAIEYMQTLFTMLAKRTYMLSDSEAQAFIPYFIVRLGDPKDPIRKGFRTIVKQISQVYAPVKVFNQLVAGLTSKNSRQRAECLEEMGQMIEAIGLTTLNPQVNLKEIAKQIADRDTSVRNAALNTITIAYQMAGEQVYKYIGKLSEKDQSMLDERIKRSAKTIPQSNSKLSVKDSGVSVSSSQSNTATSQQPLTQSNSHSSIATSNNDHSNEEQHQPESKVLSNNEKLNRRLQLRNELQKEKESLKQQTTPRVPLQRGQTQPIISTTNIQQTKPKGEFSLDIKDDDDDINVVQTPKLETHKDLDELLNQPVGLPPRKNTITFTNNYLKESQDCKEAIDLTITHISHQQIDISFQHLLQIDYVIKDKAKRELLHDHIDNLLNTCAVKLNVVSNVYLSAPDCRIDECFKLFKGLFAVIVDVFETNLGKNCNVKTLKDVIYNLLCVMIDPKVVSLPDSEQIVKALNMVTLKVLEYSDQTNNFCALIRLLTDCCGYEEFSVKYLELVMKCIWRQIRRLTGNENLISQINTAKVLNEIHTFLKLFPSSSWIGKQNDLPIRTMKTLLFHLAKAKQQKLFDDLSQIDNVEESEIRSYLMKLFKNGFQSSQAQTPGTLSTGQTSRIQAPTATMTKKSQSCTFNDSQTSPLYKQSHHPQSSSSLLSPEKSRQLNEELSIIFKKISSTSESKQGLYDLYEFKLTNPDIDLSRHLKKTSESFQKYIEDGLKKIELENINKQNIENLKQTSPTLAHNSSSSATTTSNNYLQPLSGSSLLTTNALSSNNLNRNPEDILKSIADWKSQKHLNTTTYDNDDDPLRKKDIDQPIKADKYLDMVNNLKKKYTRARTEVRKTIIESLSFFELNIFGNLQLFKIIFLANS